jgi:uncharacterized sulfatase
LDKGKVEQMQPTQVLGDWRWASWIVMSVALSAWVAPSVALAESATNVVWIIADDLGPELGCYGYPGVSTPNLDRLATEGARYVHAFSTAPVCSPSRTAFQTGQYQTTVGGHHHDTRLKPKLPESSPTVTGLMRAAGYFVCNGRGKAVGEKRLAKSHFNFQYDARTFFDGHDWTQRAEGQPFFAQVQIKEPHRTFVERTGDFPDSPIPPYYPDHPVTRADWANYLSSIEVLDAKVGEVLDRLDDEGLADNTLVIFFGDHGRPHVRGKQWLYDGGLHVPLLVRWPAKVRPGTVDERLVSLLDLMPTTLAVAGVAVPDQVKLVGGNLMDANWDGHERLFAARDRCGEAVDRIRSMRTRDFKYIRNFRPEIPYMQHSSYKRLQYPVDTLMRVLHAEGRWTSPLMAANRPVEELYDLAADPYEMNNLAGDPAYHERIESMRGEVENWIRETDDKGRTDESLTVDLEALRAEKWEWYTKTMKARGLDPRMSDREYLDWWMRELGVAE